MEEKNTNEITSTNTTETTAQPIEEPVQSEQKASENKNTNKPKKGNRLLIVLLVLIALGAIGYIVYDKIIASDKPNNEINEVNKNKGTNNNDNKDNNDNNNLNNNNTNNTDNNDNNNTNNTDNNDNNNTNNGSFTELDCHDGNGCEFTKGNFNFKIVNLENESITGEALYINGNKVLENGWIIFYEENFLVLNDIAIVHIGEGLDHWTTFKIYDLQGNLLLDGKTIDSKFGENMLLSVLDDNVKPIYLEGNKIKINATRFSHGPSILGEDGLINQNTSCDTVVMGTYEIEYYGNGSLSEIKNTGYVTLRESINNYGYDYNNYVNCN